MNRSNSNPRQLEPYLKILKYSPPLIALSALLAYGYVVIYYSGYLRAFEIDIHMIDFFPKLVDVTFWGAISCIAFIVTIVIFLASMHISTILSEKAASALAQKYKKLQWLKPDNNELPRQYHTTIIYIALLVFAFSLVFYIADKQGYEKGKAQEQFTVIVENDSNDVMVLIYQNGDTGIFKRYDRETKSFSKTYAIESVNNKVFENISLDR